MNEINKTNIEAALISDLATYNQAAKHNWVYKFADE